MPAERLHDGSSLTIDRLVVGPLDNNVLIVSDPRSGDAVIVDAADDAPSILNAVGELGVEVSAIVTTHGHWDHHQAAHLVGSRLDAPVLLHPADEAITDLEADPLVVGELPVGSSRLRIVHTPGHTPGSVCLVGDGVAITGDTLFPGGPGATRFPYSDFDTIIDSIERQLFTLPDDTLVLPGHGDSTTVGTERPQLQDWIDRRW